MINLFLVLFLLGLGLTFWILFKRDPKIETPKIEEEPTNVFPILVEVTPKKKPAPRKRAAKMSPAKKKTKKQ